MRTKIQTTRNAEAQSAMQFTVRRLPATLLLFYSSRIFIFSSPFLNYHCYYYYHYYYYYRSLLFLSFVSGEGLAPIVSANSRLILVDGTVL